MKPIVFENDAGTQKITVLVRTRDDAFDGESDVDVTVKFEPIFGQQDESSLHYVMATQLIQSLRNH